MTARPEGWTLELAVDPRDGPDITETHPYELYRMGPNTCTLTLSCNGVAALTVAEAHHADFRPALLERLDAALAAAAGYREGGPTAADRLVARLADRDPIRHDGQWPGDSCRYCYRFANAHADDCLYAQARALTIAHPEWRTPA